MESILQILFSPIQPFVGHPERAFIMAGVFVILLVASAIRAEGFKPRIHRIILMAVVLWVLFGLNENQAKAKGWDIRVDLLLFYPVLFVLSISAAWRGIRHIVGKQGANKPPEGTR